MSNQEIELNMRKSVEAAQRNFNTIRTGRANPTLLEFTDSVNMWGLTIVGLSLILGFMSRYGAIAGLVFVLLYYFFAPPFIGLEYSKPGEGSYIIVNKNLIEACALYVLYLFPTSQLIGFDRLILSIQSKQSGVKS